MKSPQYFSTKRIIFVTALVYLLPFYGFIGFLGILPVRFCFPLFYSTSSVNM